MITLKFVFWKRDRDRSVPTVTSLIKALIALMTS